MVHDPTTPSEGNLPSRDQVPEAARSVELLGRVTDLVDAAIYVYDLAEQRVVFGNRALLRVYGVEEGGVVDSALFAERLHPIDRAATRERMAQLRAMADGEWTEWVHRFRHTDGSYRWLVSRDSVFARDAGGAVTQILGTAHDITDRRLAEEHERRERARSAVYVAFAKALAAPGMEERTLLRGITTELAEQLDAGCVVVLEDDEGPYVRPVAWHHREERITAALGEMFLQDPWERDAPPLAEIFLRGKPQLLTPDFIDRVKAMGGHTWKTLDELGLVEAAIVPLWSHGAVVGAFCLMRFARSAPYLTDDLAFLQQIADSVALAIDNARLLARLRQELAERRRAEEELRRSRDLLRVVFEGLDEALMLLDGAGTILAVNERFAALCGVAEEALVGRMWSERAADVAPFFPGELIDASRAAGAPRQRRARAADGLGRMRMLDLHVVPLATGDAGAEWLLVRVIDVTEQLQIEARMIAMERLAANERLAATVAHEVNTPLQAIESSLHLAGKLDNEEQRAAYLRLAREEIQRIGRILRQLLDLHRPQEVPMPLQVNELVERVMLLSGGNLRRRGIHLTRELADSLPQLIGRADELTQVLLNLVVNAVQVMPRGGRLTLRTELRREGDAPALVVVTVQDNGPGVDPALGERIFEPFFTTREGGTGLGLAVSRQIVESHNGRIRLESAPGEGACFRIELPVPSRESP